MESLDSPLRLPTRDATPRPGAPTPAPPGGQAFVDLLSRAQAPGQGTDSTAEALARDVPEQARSAQESPPTRPHGDLERDRPSSTEDREAGEPTVGGAPEREIADDRARAEAESTDASSDEEEVSETPAGPATQTSDQDPTRRDGADSERESAAQTQAEAASAPALASEVSGGTTEAAAQKAPAGSLSTHGVTPAAVSAPLAAAGALPVTTTELTGSPAVDTTQPVAAARTDAAAPLALEVSQPASPTAAPEVAPLPELATDAASLAGQPTLPAEGDAASTQTSRSEALAGAAATASEAREPGTQRATSTAPRPVADPEALQRAEQILDQLRVKLSPKLRQATLTLRPAELGRLIVRMEVEAGKVHAQLLAESPDSLTALQQHVPELRAMLEQRGLEVNTLDLGLAGDASDFDLDAGAGGDGSSDDGASRGDAAATVLDERTLKPTLARAVASEDSLDLFA